MHDLLLHLNNTDSFKMIENKIYKTNFLIWTGNFQSKGSLFYVIVIEDIPCVSVFVSIVN